MGPKEIAVRATLDGRPASTLRGIDRAAQNCFAGFFSGAKSTGTILQPEADDLSIGKSECEWDWRSTWGELKQAGLIDWTEEDVPCFDGSKMKRVHLTITEKGHSVRADDLAYFRDLMNAMDADEKVSN